MVTRVAVIGYGYWGPNLVRNFTKLEGCEVVAVTDLEVNRLEFVRRLYPNIEITTDCSALLGRNDIDAVAIITPVSTHYELVRKALLAGKHVLVSKPMCQTAKEAEELILIAENAKRILMVDHTFIYSGPVRSIRTAMEAGDLGNIYSYDSTRINLGLFQHDVNVIWDLAPHDLSIMLYLLDEKPTRISVIAACPQAYSRLESIAYLAAYFANGMIAHFHLSWLSPLKIRRTLLCGTRKMVVYDHLDPDNQVKVYDKGIDVSTLGDMRNLLVQYRSGDMHAPKVDQTEPLEIESKHFLDSIRGGSKPDTDGTAGLEVVRLLEAAQQSLMLGGECIQL